MGKILDLTTIQEALLTDTGEDNDLSYLKSNGPRALPNSPTANKWSPEAILKQFYKQPEILFAWLKELSDAVNGLASQIDDLLGEGTVYSAERDGEKDVISEKYASKAYVDGKDAAAVHIEGSETITGNKTFNVTTTFKDNVNIMGEGSNLNILDGWIRTLNSLSFKVGLTDSSSYSFPFISDGNSYTIATKDMVDAYGSGDSIADKARKDANNNNIASTYETKTDAQAKVAVNNLRTILGLASTSAQGLMSAEDKSRLDALYALLGTTEDSDTVVNTINEVLAIFAQYPEGVTLANALAAKVSFSDVINNTNSNEISKPLSAYQGKVLNDRLEEVEGDYISQDNALAIGLINISDIDTVPDELEFDSNGDVDNDNWTGELTIEYNNSAMAITSSDVPSTLTFNTTNDFDNLITNANWTGELTFTY